MDKLVENFEALAKLSLKEGNEKKSDVATDKEKNVISSLLYTCKKVSDITKWLQEFEFDKDDKGGLVCG